MGEGPWYPVGGGGGGVMTRGSDTSKNQHTNHDPLHASYVSIDESNPNAGREWGVNAVYIEPTAVGGAPTSV